MKVYLTGRSATSETRGLVLVTVETINDVTDMNGITFYEGDRLLSPFFMEYPINCGYISNITDLFEKQQFDTASIPMNGVDYTVKKGQYFKISNYNYKTAEHIKCYRHKVAACEKAEYVSPVYTGITYSHYPSGLVHKKYNYVNGKLHSYKVFRDDRFNTLEECLVYKDSYIYCRFEYNNTETFQSQTWYNSNGTVFLEQKHFTPVVVHNESPCVPVTPDQSEASVDVASDQGSGSSTADMIPDVLEEPHGNPNAGVVAGCKVKPRPSESDNSTEGTENSGGTDQVPQLDETEV